MVDAKGVYSTLTQLAVISESTRWERFYVFLVANTLLILAWIQLYTANKLNIVGVLLTALGFTSGITWYLLAKRGSEYLKFYEDEAIKIEECPTAFTPNLPTPFKTAKEKFKSSRGFHLGASETILTFFPILLSFIQFVLFVMSVCVTIPHA